MATSRPPSVDAVIRDLPDGGAPRSLVAEVARQAVDMARPRIQAGESVDVVAEARAALDRAMRQRLGKLINATGVLLHTNLGRAPLHPEAAEAAAAASTAYTNLEFDVETGLRGKRATYVTRLLAGLTGAEAALVVNNNAGGLFLALSALARGRTVPVSRGELIEIGGSYRLPELMDATGARLIEVGTTNRTRIDDYEQATTTETALLLKVHPSNYRIVGFSEEASLSELAALGNRADLPVVFDVGSGLLDEEVPWLAGPPPSWLEGEPGVRQSLKAGADLVLFSGDKLLGGPQAGLVVGRLDLVERLRSHPIARALRTDGATLAALGTTMELYADGTGDVIPFWRMATIGYDDLTRRSSKVASGLAAEIVRGESLLGAGSVPGRGIATPLISFVPDDSDRAWAALLRAGLVARREAGSIVLDLRAVPESFDDEVREALSAVCPS